MTSIVGVLNKQAVAIAADSAVTFGGTHKVMNTGNKLFTLSKHAPVGVAIFGNASLMATPWELIIKSYRRQLAYTKFLYLRDYVSDFIDYLKKHEFFASPMVQRKHMANQMKSFYEICKQQAKREPGYATNPSQSIIDELNRCKQLNKANLDLFEDFKDYSYAEFILFAKDDINEVVKGDSLLNTAHGFDIFAESYYYYLRVAHIARNNESGLVFVGYGEEEIYPCLYNLVITIGFKHRLQCTQGEPPIEITNEATTASVVPFAQIEATQTVIRGINPAFYNIISNNFLSVMGIYRNLICDILKKNGLNSLASQIEGIDIADFSTTFTETTKREFNNNYTQPLVNTIDHLGISDMANVAESLVSITSLIHRMSPREESVGGPIDVAVISKGDGFIWIKRKHYFDPNLNTQFFNNYDDD